MIRKLKTIMVVSFVFVNALFLAGVSYASYQYFFDFTSEKISETELSLLNESANKLSSFITNISEAGTFIAIDRSVMDIFDGSKSDPYDALVERNELKNLINHVATLKQEIYSIELYTNRFEEYPYLYDEPIMPESRLLEKDWFSPFIESVDNGWVPRHTSTLTNQEMISYVHRIINQRSDTVGYLKVNVLADTFIDHLVGTDLYEEINEPFVLLNTGGRIIAETHSREEFPILNEITTQADNALYERLKPEYDQLSNHHELIRSGNEYYLLLISNPNYEQWRLVQVIPVDDLYADMQGLGIFVLIIGFVALILSIPIVYGIGKWITTPISQMVQGMRKVEKGQFDVEMNRHYIEEYDILAKNFNQMTTELSDLIKRVDRENKNRREAEVRALQSQIMPHFLYNTLDMIKWKSLDHDAANVDEMVNKLSKMLRIGLSGGLKFIQLRDELEHAKCFIDIQKQRLNQKINYRVRVPASMKELYVPKIILQPFIENSMKHGYHLPETKQMNIQVNAILLEEDHALQITIIDDGIGLPEDWSYDQATGIGIKNVRERIWMYCGQDFDVVIQNHYKQGVCVQITLPVIKEEPRMGNSETDRSETGDIS
ncbi:sensor histidine kinase [Gracilibacillus sp. YIM 98692]|uniref:sensor histidine kinase n=1 Tax=Gracilibacillus sp. YIM 98692 TaxID=2663532 RepID=UPI0013D847E2|nr:sensor histidine kinase [Gracilibacillus sp. YIM 98692]